MGDILLDCDNNTIDSADTTNTIDTANITTESDPMTISPLISPEPSETKISPRLTPMVPMAAIDAKTQISVRLKHHEEMGVDTSAIHASMDRTNSSSREQRYNKVGAHTDRFTGVGNMNYSDEYPDEEEYSRNHAPRMKNTVHTIPKPKPGRVPYAATPAHMPQRQEREHDVRQSLPESRQNISADTATLSRGTLLNFTANSSSSSSSDKLIRNANNNLNNQNASCESGLEIELETYSFCSTRNANGEVDRGSVFDSSNPLHCTP